MNPVQTKIKAHLNSFPPEFEPLRDACIRYLTRCSVIETDGTILIAHQPWVGPLAYAIQLFPAAKESWFSKYAKIHDMKIPTALRPFLRITNGCYLFGISLCGMPPSMLNNPPLLDRSLLQCHDIGTANKNWKKRFKVSQDAFHFGGRHYSNTENAGYFFHEGAVISILENGQFLGQWNSL